MNEGVKIKSIIGVSIFVLGFVFLFANKKDIAAIELQPKNVYINTTATIANSYLEPPSINLSLSSYCGSEPFDIWSKRMAEPIKFSAHDCLNSNICSFENMVGSCYKDNCVHTNTPDLKNV